MVTLRLAMKDQDAVTVSELARRLRAAREAAHLTQEQVAAELGVSRPTVSQIESGTRSVTSLEIDRLAYLYGRALTDFFAAEFDPEDTVVALFRAPVGAPEKAVEAVAEVRRCIALAREARRLEQLVGAALGAVQAPPTYELPTMGRKWDAVEQGLLVAREERRRLGLGEAPAGNIVDLLQGQGVHAAVVPLPKDVSGLTLLAADLGSFVVANQSDQAERKRFSFAHEYAHVLLDRSRRGVVSRVSERDDLAEVRANSFAAAFLMPENGVRAFVATLGKGRPSRLEAEVFGEGSEQTAVAHVEARSAPGSQELQIYDVVQLAHHFGVSRLAMLYRLLNLGLLNRPRFDALKAAEDRGEGRAVTLALGLPDDGPGDGAAEFQARFLALALEAYRRDEISGGKLRELARLSGGDAATVERLLEAARFERDEGVGVELPPDLA